MLSYDHLAEPTLVPRSAGTLRQLCKLAATKVVGSRKITTADPGTVRAKAPAPHPSEIDIFGMKPSARVDMSAGPSLTGADKRHIARLKRNMRKEQKGKGPKPSVERRSSSEDAKPKPQPAPPKPETTGGVAQQVASQKAVDPKVLESSTKTPPKTPTTAEVAPGVAADTAGSLWKGTKAVLGGARTAAGWGGKGLGYAAIAPALMGLGTLSLLSPKKKRRREEELFGARDPYGALASRYYM